MIIQLSSNLQLLESWMELTRAKRHIDYVIVGTRTEAQFLRSLVGIGSESDCLLGKLRRIFEISASLAGLKVCLLYTSDAADE